MPSSELARVLCFPHNKTEAAPRATSKTLLSPQSSTFCFTTYTLHFIPAQTTCFAGFANISTLQNNKARRATATASNNVLAKDIQTSAHKRNKSASNISKMAGNKQQQRAFGDDVSNARKVLNAGFVGGDLGYKKNIENIKPNLTGTENGKGLIAPAVRPAATGVIAGKTQQVSLTTLSG